MMQDTFTHKGLRLRMVESLKEKGITDDAVLKAMNDVPRHFFLPAGLRRFPDPPRQKTPAFFFTGLLYSCRRFPARPGLPLREKTGIIPSYRPAAFPIRRPPVFRFRR